MVYQGTGTENKSKVGIDEKIMGCLGWQSIYKERKIMYRDFHVGDRVVVINFTGKVLLKTRVARIASDGSIRVYGWKNIFCKNGIEKKTVVFWTDTIGIMKV